MDKPSDWVVLTQRLGYCSKGWVKHLTQLLIESNPIAGSKQPNRWVYPYFTLHFFREYLFQSASNKTLKPLMKIQLLIIPLLFSPVN